jgi:hypothetical protein
MQTNRYGIGVLTRPAEEPPQVELSPSLTCGIWHSKARLISSGRAARLVGVGLKGDFRVIKCGSPPASDSTTTNKDKSGKDAVATSPVEESKGKPKVAAQRLRCCCLGARFGGIFNKAIPVCSPVSSNFRDPNRTGSELGFHSSGIQVGLDDHPEQSAHSSSRPQ